MKFNQEYIQGLIDNKNEEGLSLEYKAAGALRISDRAKKDISIDVSSFANANGGVIIYGIQEDKNNKHLPSQIDSIDRNMISKEWLEQIIDSRIHPKIEGIEIHPIEIDGTPSRVVYVVDIPQSTTAHQADDKRYHKRRNFKSDIMDDYEIRDVMNRSKTPIIELEFEVERSTTHEPLNPTEIGAFAKTHPVYHYYLNVIAVNKGNILANYINANLTIPRRCILNLHAHFVDRRLENYSAINKFRERTGVDSISASTYEPLLPGLSMNLLSNVPELHNYFFDPENEIIWEVYADNAEPKSGKIACDKMKVVTNEGDE